MMRQGSASVPAPPAAAHVARLFPAPVSGVGTLRIAREALARVRAHGRAAYPAECCGALFGRPAHDGAREVLRAVPARNRHEDRTRRYAIPAATVRALEAAATDAGLELVGFYHSHPDGSATPSRLDRELGWPWYSFLIVPLADGRCRAPRAWRLRDDRRGFVAERLITLDGMDP